jgi:ketosteroid isomerase-like protein
LAGFRSTHLFGKEEDVTEQVFVPAAIAAAASEADAVATLHELNADYIRAFAEGDVAWYGEHLSDAFVCTLADGRRIGKSEFLRQAEAGPNVVDVTCDEVDVRPLGELAIVHGVTHYTRDGKPAATRYTDVWQSRAGRWKAVTAQLTRVVQ